MLVAIVSCTPSIVFSIQLIRIPASPQNLNGGAELDVAAERLEALQGEMVPIPASKADSFLQKFACVFVLHVDRCGGEEAAAGIAVGELG